MRAKLLTLLFAALLPLGVCAVDTTTVINEVMYHPSRASDSEWIELHNLMAVDMDLSGWRITGGVNFTLPENSVISAGGFLIVASDPAALKSSTGISGVLGPWTGALDNSSETIRLLNRIGRIMDEFHYEDSGRFPVAADGGGVSLAKKSPQLASSDSSNWTFSAQVNGSPGDVNFPKGQVLGPPVTLTGFNDAWIYNETGADRGSEWAKNIYTAGSDDWKSGSGVFMVGSAPLPVNVGTTLSAPDAAAVSHYFQRKFSFSSDPTRAVLRLTTLVDDGAIFFLNGYEVARYNMPSGPVTATTRPVISVGTATLSQPISLPTEHLLQGENVLSVETRQSVEVSGGGLTLVEQGGTMDAANNLALASKGSVAFAKDLIANGDFAPTHTIANLNNGSYGNPSSWIGDSLNSFCGIRLGNTPVTVQGIAWGRDNTGTYSDRTQGTYIIQYTTVATPSASTPDTDWTTIGAVNYAASTDTLFSASSRRHRFNFAPVSATAIRVICPGSGLSDGACIDELELYSNAVPLPSSSAFRTTATAGFTITRTGMDGTSGSVPVNLASASNGAQPFGSSELGGGGLYTIAHINNGTYGNSSSWISAGGAGQYVGVKFPTAVTMNRVAWGRDNTGTYIDRSIGTYTLQFTTATNPGVLTPETEDAASGWQTIASVAINGSNPTFSQARRHEFRIARDEGGTIAATAFRIKVSDGNLCIDELEVAGPPQIDVVFGAQLVVQEPLPDSGKPGLAINEIGGSNDGTWRIELRNTGDSGIALGNYVLAASSTSNSYTLPAQILPPGGLLVLDQAQLGFRPQFGDRVFLYNSSRSTLLDAAVVRTTPRARLGSEFLSPSAATFGSENVFTLESNVIINEVMYNFPANPGTSGSPPTTNPEEWIELYNRGSATVALDGWTLDDAVEFTFPPNTNIPPGGFVVVAKDAAALRIKWPESATKIIGNFSGQLSNSGERIVLKDAIGNPANELHYLTGGAWPSLPDGGGFSLELRDPRADNSAGSAWASSDQSADSNWQTVSYRSVAGQTFGQILWNEFRIGLLGEGECLIDDVSVIRDPDGARQELVQDGSFQAQSNKWRMLGNHGTSTVELEPGSGSNYVLHLRATGPFGFNHNHIESTFINNTAITNGQTYQVSFRVRWLAGNNQLNTRAYYSRLARTTGLALPTRIGTPGMQNSRFSTNIGPGLQNLEHSPVIPTASEAVKVRVHAADPDGVASIALKYALNGSASFSSVAMVHQANGLYAASIPAQPAGTIVQFYIEADDAAGASSQIPAAGPKSRALYVVNDGQGSSLAAHEMRVVMLPADSAKLLATANRLSDARIGGTAIYRRSEVFYDVGVRLQGTAAGRIRDGESYPGYDIGFPADHLFRGVHDSVNIDRSGRAPTVRGQDEIYVKHLFHAAKLPCTYDDLCYLIAPASVHTGTAVLQMAGYENTFVESQFGGDGAVFNLDGTYEPSTTVNGNPESPKNPVPLAAQLDTDFTNLGSDKEQYRGALEIRAGRKLDDYSGLIAFCQTMALPTAQLTQQIRTRMDVDEWLRCAALYSLLGVGDCYMTGGFNHNFRVYVPPSGNGVVALPWDMDFIFSHPTNASPILASGNLRRIIDQPAFRRLYYGHLYDLCNTVFKSSYIAPWLLHYGSVVGQNMKGGTSYIDARRASVLSQLPASVAFAITTNNGSPFSIDANSAALEGTGWINIREFRRADTGAIVPSDWTSQTTWRVNVGLTFGENRITLQAYDSAGALVGTQSITITSTRPNPNVRDFLRITEIHYHPASPSGAELTASLDAEDFEFIELRNIGTEALDISGCAFTAGISIVIPENTSLTGGESVVLVRNSAAFRARYGDGPRIVGVYGPTDALSNSGETLTLVDSTGAVIQNFAYRDTLPWPTDADGAGYSLTAIAPNLPLDRNSPASWRSSVASGGSPSNGDASGFTGSPNVDADLDGLNALLEYAFGTNDTSPASGPGSVGITSDRGGLLFTHSRRLSADDVEYLIEGSADLRTWQPLNLELARSIRSGETLIQSYWLPSPTLEQPQLSVRLRVRTR